MPVKKIYSLLIRRQIREPGVQAHIGLRTYIYIYFCSNLNAAAENISHAFGYTGTNHVSNWNYQVFYKSAPTASAEPEGGTGGPDPPWKMTNYMGFYRE